MPFRVKTTIILSGFLFCLLVGCSSGSSHRDSEDFNPLENGFGFVQHSKKTYPMHSAVWAGFVYQGSNGTRVAVWPYIDEIEKIQITNNLAVLVGGKAELYEDGRERLRQRLIAFEAPAGPPMDITDQVLQKYSAESGVELTNIIKDTFVYLTKSNAALKIDFSIINIGERGPGTKNMHHGTEMISWRDIEAIMQDIKKTGTLKKEKWSGTEYLQKE